MIINTESGEPAAGITGSHVVIQDISIKGALQAPGIQASKDSTHVSLRNCEIAHCGTSVILRGSFHTVSDCHIHDMDMIRNTPGGDDDHGTDGGTIELWKTCRRLEICGNWSEDNNGFMEIGGTAEDQVEDIHIHHDVSLNDIAVFVPHVSGTFSSKISSIVYDHNTIAVFDDNAGYSLFFGPVLTLPSGMLSVGNNIFHTPGSGAGRIFRFADPSGLTHAYNLYSRPASEIFKDYPAFIPGTGEITGQDPLLTDILNGDASPGAGSPARNADSSTPPGNMGAM